MEVPKTLDKRLLLGIVIFLIVLGVMWRVTPHQPNFAPVGAIALTLGMICGWRKSLLAMIILMALSDIVIGPYSGMEWTWLGVGLIGGVGLLIRNLPLIGRIILGSLGASIIFFVVSNFGTWLTSGMYSHDLAGFIQCYVMAVPFFKATLLSDVIFIATLQASYEVFIMRVVSQPKITSTPLEVYG